MADRTTKAQASVILRLFKKLEYSTTACSAFHRNVGCPERFMGRPPEEWLDTLSIKQASELIYDLSKKAK